MEFTERWHNAVSKPDIGELLAVMPDNYRGLDPGMYRVIRVDTLCRRGRRNLAGTYDVTSVYDRPLPDDLVEAHEVQKAKCLNGE